MSEAAPSAIPLLYRGSVKDLYGTLECVSAAGTTKDALAFQYSDAFSVFDWGRMPDLLPEKGRALALMAGYLFEKLESPETWKTYSKTQHAMKLRKEVSLVLQPSQHRSAWETALPVSLSSGFNDLGEKLQTKGLRTHAIGFAKSEDWVKAGKPGQAPLKTYSSAELSEASQTLLVRRVHVSKPEACSIFGKEVMDYERVRAAPKPKLVPLEVIFRFSLPQGSSLLAKAKDPSFVRGLLGPRILSQMTELTTNDRFDLPILELFTKLEPEDRRLTIGEAVNFSGLTAYQLQDLLLRTVWVSGYLKEFFSQWGIKLADGKLEWGLDERGELVLVDAIGPDELRLLYQGVPLSKEFLRICYRDSTWYAAVQKAKDDAKKSGTLDWKKLCTEQPPKIGREDVELGAQIYWSLANLVTGKTWFKGAWDFKEVANRLSAKRPT